ncbi:hypothetical protein JL720_1463 [Aureococcus anophagefferens]|nr:hypothetical protein JL720_1463 [Aureococcus anophagefferens]
MFCQNLWWLGALPLGARAFYTSDMYHGWKKPEASDGAKASLLASLDESEQSLLASLASPAAEPAVAALVEAIGEDGGLVEAIGGSVFRAPAQEAHATAAGVCVFASGSAQIDGCDLKDPATHGDDVDYLRTVAATNASIPPPKRAAWGIIDRGGDGDAAEPWPSRAPFFLAADAGGPCDRATRWLEGEAVPDVVDSLLKGTLGADGGEALLRRARAQARRRTVGRARRPHGGGVG